MMITDTFDIDRIESLMVDARAYATQAQSILETLNRAQGSPVNWGMVLAEHDASNLKAKLDFLIEDFYTRYEYNDDQRK